MRKLLVLLCFINLTVFSQNLYKDFEYVTVKGQVKDRLGNPVPECPVELRIISQGGRDVAMMSTGTYSLSKLDKAGWARTDDSGNFSIQGIPSPGSYVIAVTGMKGYKKTQRPLRVDKTRGDVLEIPALILDKYEKIDKKTKKLLSKMNDYTGEGKWEKAAAVAEKILKQRADLPDPYFVLGNSSIQQKEFDKALTYFEKAIELGATNPEIYSTAAKIAFSQKQFKKTVSILEKGVMLGIPKDIDYFRILSQAYYSDGNREKTKEVIGEMLQTIKDFKGKEEMEALFKEL